MPELKELLKEISREDIEKGARAHNKRILAPLLKLTKGMRALRDDEAALVTLAEKERADFRKWVTKKEHWRYIPYAVARVKEEGREAVAAHGVGRKLLLQREMADLRGKLATAKSEEEKRRFEADILRIQDEINKEDAVMLAVPRHHLVAYWKTEWRYIIELRALLDKAEEILTTTPDLKECVAKLDDNVKAMQAIVNDDNKMPSATRNLRVSNDEITRAERQIDAFREQLKREVKVEIGEEKEMSFLEKAMARTAKALDTAPRMNEDGVIDKWGKRLTLIRRKIEERERTEPEAIVVRLKNAFDRQIHDKIFELFKKSGFSDAQIADIRRKVNSDSKYWALRSFREEKAFSKAA